MVAFAVAAQDPVLARTAPGWGGPAEVVIWTTTRWTLPGDVAIAVQPDAEHVWAPHMPERLTLVAAQRLAALAELLGVSAPAVRFRAHGRALEGLQTLHPMYGRPLPLLLGSSLTLMGCLQLPRMSSSSGGLR